MIDIVWDEKTRTLIERGGGYGRMTRLRGSRDILCVYERAGKVWSRRSADNGRTWKPAALAGQSPFGNAANAEALELRDGRLLFFYNERPTDGVHPFAIRMSVSRDGGAAWTPRETPLYTAGAEFKNGCWEPAAIQLPSGEIQLFFANEGPYRTTEEQEITLLRSRDGGESWGTPETVSFRAGKRDGMPVPLLLAGDAGIVVAIEDNGISGDDYWKIAIVHTTRADNWRGGRVTGDSPRRRAAITDPLPPKTYVSAPYIRQLPSGETVLSGQTNLGGRKEPMMVVFVGDRNARNFRRATMPFRIPSEVGGWWNSVFVKDERTVTALSGTTIDGVSGLWTIDGRIVRQTR